MLPSGLQMLLLWLLLCIAKLGLSSPQSQGDIMTGPVPEDVPTLYYSARDGVGEEPIRAQPEGMCKESVEEEMEREPEYYPTNVNHVKMVDGSSGELGDLGVPLCSGHGRKLLTQECSRRVGHPQGHSDTSEKLGLGMVSQLDRTCGVMKGGVQEEPWVEGSCLLHDV